MSDGDLQDLIRRAASGDREAAGALTRRYERHVRARLHGRLGADLRARADTEDLFQSTITAILRDLPGFTYRSEKEFVAWLSTVAERQILMKARHGRAAIRDVGRQRPLKAAAGVPVSATSPSEGAVREELAVGIRDALTQLPEAERRVIELHTFEGESFERVAEILALSGKGAAYRLFERALKSMGAILDHQDDASAPRGE